MEDKIRIDLLLYHETFVADTVLFERLENVAKIALKICGVEIGAANIVLTDDNTIQDLNKSHRGLDEVTDVLSFSKIFQDLFLVKYSTSHNSLLWEELSRPPALSAPRS